MNWNNLKNMKCPKCGIELVTNNSGKERMIGCGNDENCDFRISLTRFNSLVDDLYKGKGKIGYKPQFGDDLENLEKLSNL